MQRVSSLSARTANVKHARLKVRAVQTITESDGLMQKKEEKEEDLLKELCAGDAKLLAVLNACMFWRLKSYLTISACMHCILSQPFNVVSSSNNTCKKFKFC